MKCEKEDANKKEELPEETQSGKQTFGCLVNGEVWLPRANFPYSGLTTTIQYDILSLTAGKSNETIHMGVRNLTGIGEYQLNIDGQNVYYVKGENSFICTAGKLTITTFNKTNQIISGRFYFTAKNTIGDSVEIKDGRFDVRYTN